MISAVGYDVFAGSYRVSDFRHCKISGRSCGRRSGTGSSDSICTGSTILEMEDEEEVDGLEIGCYSNVRESPMHECVILTHTS